MVSFRSNLAGFLSLLILAITHAPAQAEDFIGRWLQAQTNVQAWSAGFTQTRSLKALSEPLVSTGKVYFASPGFFRWELGQPAETIAIRSSNALWVIYPKLKRAEKYPMDGNLGPWKDALALLEAGFPQSENDLNNRFKVLEQKVSGDQVEIVLQPKSTSARKMMPQLLIRIHRGDFHLTGTELHFGDGSKLRNDFYDPKPAKEVDQTLFAAPTSDAFKIVEPLKR